MSRRKPFLTVLGATLIATSLLAQQLERAPVAALRLGKIGLLRLAAVQDELALNQEQQEIVAAIVFDFSTKSDDLRALVRTAWPEDRPAKSAEVTKRLAAHTEALEKELQEVLSQEQLARWEEIWLQARGASALFDAKVMARLGLSEEQQQQVAEIEKHRKEAAAQVSPKPARTEAARAAVSKAHLALREEADKKAFAVLSPEQRNTLERLQGKRIQLDSLIDESTRRRMMDLRRFPPR